VDSLSKCRGDPAMYDPSQRTFFVLMAVMLLLLTTWRFSADLPAFVWSLVVLAGAMWFEDGGAANSGMAGRGEQ